MYTLVLSDEFDLQYDERFDVFQSSDNDKNCLKILWKYMYVSKLHVVINYVLQDCH